MQVERIEEMRLTPKDEAGISRVLGAAFNVDFGGRSFYQNRHHLRFVVRDDDLIVGHMALSLRAFRMGKRLLHAVGLAEVATDPEYRGRGIATAMMTAAIAEARTSIADFLILYGNQPLYTGVGFVAKPNHTLTVSMHDVKTGILENRKEDGLMVMQLRDTNWDDDAVIDLVGFAF